MRSYLAQDEANKHEKQNIVIDETMTCEEEEHSKLFGGLYAFRSAY